MLTTLAASALALVSVTAMIVQISMDLEGADFVWPLAAVGAGLAVSIFSASFVALIRKSYRKPRIFLSYSLSDKKVADGIRDALKQQTEVWDAAERIRPGDDVRKSIEKGLADADFMLVVLGKQLSPWMESEVHTALERGLRVIPIVASHPLQIPEQISGLKYIDLENMGEKGIEEVLRSVTGQ